MPSLSASSYVILGLLDRYGPTTPYGLDRGIRASIGFFWGFPRSQLYDEAARLARLGLVDQVQEDTGRRRRLLTITPAGSDALARWVQEPTTEPSELHDGGLLRLFFVEHCPDPVGALAALAAEQEALHRRRLENYRAMVGVGGMREGSPQRATLELGLRYEELVSDFWAEVRLHPPDLAHRERST